MVRQLRLESQILEEKNRNESLDSLSQTISHEFRTPISTSLMFLSQIMQNELPDGVHEMMMLIVMKLNLLLSLVNDIVDMRMIEHGNFQANLVSLDVKKVLAFVQAMFSPQCKLIKTELFVKVVRSEEFE